MILSNFIEILDEICKQKTLVQSKNKHPYYLYISPDVMETFLLELPPIFNKNKKIDSIYFFYGLEIVCIANENKYLEVKGINIPSEY